MNRRIVLWIVVGVLFVSTLFFTFKAGTVSNLESIQASGLAAKNVASQSSGGMVGGC